MIIDILGMWLRGLFSLAVLGLGFFCVGRWYQELPETVVVERVEVRHGEQPLRTEVIREEVPLATFGERWAAWHPGMDSHTGYGVAGVLLLLFALAGKYLATPWLWRRRQGGTRGLLPKATLAGEMLQLRRPDGTVLHVQCVGPATAPVLVLTHGWGCDSAEWYYLRHRLGDRYRLIAWDLPGLGRSTEPANRDYRLEKMASDLDAVISLAGSQPVTLIGHSIGGMIMLTYCRLFPEALGPRVSGLILTHTSYTNPLRTMQGASFYTALQKPLVEPLLHLTVVLSPLVWFMNCLSYFNGSAHRYNARESYAGTETWEQVEFASRYYLYNSPAVIARGVLGMLRYDATNTLSLIPIPALAIAGKEDRTTLPEASRHISSSIPRGDLAILTPARHMGLIERHEEYGELVERFCAAYAGQGVQFATPQVPAPPMAGLPTG
jgi:pimeloyl-ACP methyl ester carboxylesterase